MIRRGFSKRRKAIVPGTEAYIKARCLLYARSVGIVVVGTSQHKRNIRAGIPDAFIGHPKYGNRWIAVDFKKPDGTLSVEQKVQFDGGLLAIVDSVDAMVRVIRTHFPEIMI